MKVQLVQPPIGKYKPNSRTGSYMPLGLLSIATYLKRMKPELTVEVLDGELLTFNEIERKLDGEIIGFNTNTVTYPVALELAKTAKERGAYVVIGGVYASALPEIISEKRRDIIDTIVVGYGEKPMLDIVNGKTQLIIKNTIPEFNELPMPNREFLNIEEYIKVFQRNHPTWKYRATNVFTNVGCYWREFGKGCIFCSRSGDTTMFKNPELIWKEIELLASKYNIDYLVDFSDTLLQNKEWLKSIIKYKPKNLNPIWHVFARADEINQESITLLKTLNCKHVFIGMETGDPDIYKKILKGGGNPDDNLKACKLLHDNHIKITPSYVLGLPGENLQSLQMTYEHAKRLQELTDFEEMFCCELIPFPGSLSFKRLRNNINIADCYDIKFLKNIWIERFVETDYHIIKSYIQNILSLAKYKITIENLKNNYDNHLNICTSSKVDQLG